MNEPAVARGAGQDITWTGWHSPTDRGDAARPETARPDAAHAPRPPQGTNRAGADAQPDAEPQPRDAQPDAAFPQSYARFSINEKTHQITIKIVDAVTDEVLREIPSEEVQRIAEDLQALARRNSIGKRPQPSERVASGGVDRYV